MRVSFSDERSDPPLPDSTGPDALVALAELTLTREGLPADCEVAITLIDEASMAELNQRHMAKSGATDVLSFPLETLVPGSLPAYVAGGPPVLLGDVFVCPAVVQRNAERAAVRFADEMALMVVHGLLHLLGYDHLVDAEAEQMEQRERDLLALAGLVRP